MTETQDNHEAKRAWLLKHVEQHRATFDPNNVRDFIDLYLQTEREGDKQDHFSGTTGAGTGILEGEWSCDQARI